VQLAQKGWCQTPPLFRKLTPATALSCRWLRLLLLLHITAANQQTWLPQAIVTLRTLSCEQTPVAYGNYNQQPRLVTQSAAHLGVHVHQRAGELVHHVACNILRVLLRLRDCPVLPQVLASPVHNDADSAALVCNEHEADQMRVVQLLQDGQLLLNLQTGNTASTDI
jgi:hypothetical protein